MAKSAKSLIIVESPAKAKTINKILKEGYVVQSSMGHIIDLPKTILGIDVENNYEPSYKVIKGRKKILDALKKEAAKKEKIYLATDPDREGEAIAWHIKNKIGNEKKFLRVEFHEITEQAVKEAFLHPKDIDLNKVEAQVARRTLDRIVGYQLSPLLWKKVGSGLSAGRVQSVALRLIVEREREIQVFNPKEYWQIEVALKKQSAGEQEYDAFKARLDKKDDKKIEIHKKEDAEAIAKQLKKETFTVSDVKRSEKRRRPFAPFITSTLQQDAFNKLRFTANKTMRTAQQLYEGIELGEEGPVGLITYMRTDSTRVSDVALVEVRRFISEICGKDYLPAKPTFYKSKKSAQEAHESIRPTSLKNKPEDIEKYLSPDQFKLYELIWKRFVASQMKPAVFAVTSVKIQAANYGLSASGSTLQFDGFLRVYRAEDQVDTTQSLPPLEKNEALNLSKVNKSQHFTKPPPRFSEATLVKVLEDKGIGRPSTYASIIQTIVMRNYVHREKGYFFTTDLAFIITDMLVEYFPKVMNIEFTANMEEELDSIEEGKFTRVKVLNDFYFPFQESLKHAEQNIEKTQIFVDKHCPECGSQLSIKWGRKGRFLSCSTFPTCRYSQAYPTGIECPQENCGGELVERRSRGGKVFYGCNNFPKCTFTASRKPDKSIKAEQDTEKDTQQDTEKQ
ncbi:type I DNA topoisomerase [Candidatus Omnitrophota bacterium]